MIASCLDLSDGDVALLSQNGADGASFADDNYIGFRFTVSSNTSDNAYVTGTIYEKSIGSGSYNTAPTAEAGAVQTVATAATVTLDGTASGANDTGQTLTYAWTQSSGTDVTLSDATAAQPSFTAPTLVVNAPDEALVFSLIVNDGFENAAADTVTITVEAAANTAPTADAGAAQTVATAATVTLDGTASGANDTGQTLTYAWTQSSGTDVTLSDATAAQPSFTAPTLVVNAPDEALVFSLVVNDGVTDSDPATVTITVESLNDTTPPDTPTAENTSVSSNADGTVTVSGTTEANATVEVTFPDGTSVSVVAGANGSYTITSIGVQPAGNVEVVTIDQYGNRSASLSMTFIAAPTVEQTQEQILNLIQARAAHALAAQPNLTNLLTGNAAGRLNAQVTRGTGTFDFASSSDQPIWAQIQGNWSQTGESKNSYFLGALGGHYTLNPHAIAGMMLQFDQLSQTTGDTTAEGNGYLVGPYFVAKLPDQPLFFEGSYLFGQTENSVSIDGAAAQAFDTERSLAKLKVSGQLIYDDLTLTPSLSAARLSETQNAFMDNDSVAVAEQGIVVSDFAVGLDFSKPLYITNGKMLLTGGMSGIWSQTDGTGYADTAVSDYEGRRARVHLGTRYTNSNGATLSANFNYDGIGVNDYENWGLALGMDMKF